MTEQKHENSVSRRLQDLLAYPREDLDEELKGWLDLSLEDHKADLAQAILALANHGGGYVLIGFTRSDGNWVPDAKRPSNLNGYSQDLINGVVERYADPPFHCDVYHATHPQNGSVFPIIVVPGNHKVPIRAKRDGPNQRHVRSNTYYIRRPGPKSEAPQSAEEWNALINRCIKNAREDLLDNIREILFGAGAPPGIPKPEEEKQRFNDWIKKSTSRWQSLVDEKLADEKPSRYSHGIWTVAYSIIGDIKPITASDLIGILRKIEGRETGWPPWWVPTRTEIAPYPYDGLIECWMKETVQGDAAHSDFWLASPEGLMFLLRGYQEDSGPSPTPGTIFDLTLPIWRVGECLLHAERLATELTDKPASIRFHVTWAGLEGRTLKSWAKIRLLLEDRRCKQDVVTSEIVVSAERISATLPEIVSRITQPLYEAFEFFKPPLKLIQEELSEMRGRISQKR
jgi:transcriptional regulator with XRE-family HTH domain